ncbi:MAG: hypothetical protein ABR991_04435 [Terracidiphilus sp.]|jgi:hypothetical protein
MIWRYLMNHIWLIPLTMCAFSSPLLGLFWKWQAQADRRKFRAAEFWPIIEGKVLATEVFDVPLETNTQRFEAWFGYYFTLETNGETNYYSGEFTRLFPEDEPAKLWLESFKEKRIPIRVKPGNPDISTVLYSDLKARYPFSMQAK